jgi:hypothetical protein
MIELENMKGDPDYDYLPGKFSHDTEQNFWS